jgi:hypothetical protein
MAHGPLEKPNRKQQFPRHNNRGGIFCMEQFAAANRLENNPKATAQTLRRLAEQDTNCDNIGRLLLSDCKQVTRNRNFAATDLIKLFKHFYPKVDVEQRTKNIILFWWDGKNETQTLRRSRPTVNVETATFPADHTNVEPENFHNPEEIKAATVDEDRIIW